MPRRNHPLARQRQLAALAAYAGGLWLAAWALATSLQLVVTGTQWRQFGPPQQGWMPWLALLPALAAACAFPWLSGAALPLLVALRSGMWPALAWCVLGSAPMTLPVAQATRHSKKGNP